MYMYTKLYLNAGLYKIYVDFSTMLWYIDKHDSLDLTAPGQ